MNTEKTTETPPVIPMTSNHDENEIPESAIPKASNHDENKKSESIIQNNVVPSNIGDEDSSGLRRSTRVSKPRVDIEIGFEAERPYKKRAKTGKKPGPKSKHEKELEAKKLKLEKEKEKKMKAKIIAANKKKALLLKKKAILLKKKEVASKAKKNSTSNKDIQKKQNGIGLQEPTLLDVNWSVNVPLLSTDFRSQTSILSRLKSPNTKPVPYAGDIIKIMSFINKFASYFGSDLLGLSFQDFEVGLDLYPGAGTGSAVGIYSETKRRVVLYQDYILVKEVIASQDKMNLLFMSLLKILFSDEKRYNEPLELSDISPYPKKQIKIWLEKLRKNIFEWGYPKEWRKLTSPSRINIEAQYFATDDNVPICKDLKEILTPNIYQWPKVIPLEKDDNPLFNSSLHDSGVLGLQPIDRLILLRSLIDYCSSQSTIIHNQIYQLSHFKRDPSIGIQTQTVPRYFIEGPERTFSSFKKLCNLIQSRYEIRSKKKHYKKLLKEGKQPELQKKLDLIREIKETLKDVDSTKRDAVMISLYDKWQIVFKGELNDNPLSNPFEDPIYQLRSQEFFIGRIPYMGDFYIPKLHTYGSETEINTFTDLRSLNSLLQKFCDGTYNAYTLFENFGQNMSNQFKIFYHDTPTLVRDINKGHDISKKVYWYEVCHDTKTLVDFIELLEYKIAPPLEKSEIITETDSGTDEVVQATPQQNKEKIIVDSIINKHPLPKDAKYNSSRNKLKIMKDYLSKLLHIFKAYEELKQQYGDMKPGRRQLRRTRKQDYTDEYVSGSDNESYVPESDMEIDNTEENGEEMMEEEDNDVEDRFFEEDTEEVAAEQPKKRGPGRPRKKQRTE